MDPEGLRRSRHWGQAVPGCPWLPDLDLDPPQKRALPCVRHATALEDHRGPRKIATSAHLCESEFWQHDSRAGTMGQFGFFDADRRLAAITAKGDPLEMIARVVPFESFR